MQNQTNKKRIEFNSFFEFWPFIVLSIIIGFLVSFIILRYSSSQYKSSSIIEILDESQEREMALPTAMTVFNRSMINLENEIEVIKSYKLNNEVVKALNSNVIYLNKGSIKQTQVHKDLWFNDYNFNLKINPDTLSKSLTFRLVIKKNKLEIYEITDGEEEKNSFNNLSTFNQINDLPFDLEIINHDGIIKEKLLIIQPYKLTINNFRKNLSVSTVGDNSDLLQIDLVQNDKQIAQDYLNELISAFDEDGVSDRQLEYQRTIKFVDTRSVILAKELNKIEQRKQTFKENNNISDLNFQASKVLSESFLYDSELFKAESQKDLVIILKESLSENPFDLMPLNIGIENSSINNLISEYNSYIKDFNNYSTFLGSDNPILKNLRDQITKTSESIYNSIKNYISSLEKKIISIKDKELQYSNIFNKTPQNEKILRAIERELEVKESLFLLLLQKREEAAINFAVVKPSIKVIDYPFTDPNFKKPNEVLIFFYIISSLFSLTLIFIYLYMYFDNKFYTKKDISEMFPNSAVIGEIPNIYNGENKKLIVNQESRSPFAESIRMMIANLKFSFEDFDKNRSTKVILVTSSVKGEGKTILSTNLSSMLSAQNKVILVGADMRNPQIHKFLAKNKSTKGLADYIFRDDLNWKDLLVKNQNLHILLSGTIPPNPAQLLSSNKFKRLLSEMKKNYDYVIIDSAPTILVSDTLEISDLTDLCIFVIRSGVTNREVGNFIQDLISQNKFKKINFVLNSINLNSRYKYGYKYQYSYNYGYGYGYSEDKST